MSNKTNTSVQQEAQTIIAPPKKSHVAKPRSTKAKALPAVQIPQAVIDKITIGALSKIDEKEISKKLAKQIDKVIMDGVKEVMGSKAKGVVIASINSAVAKVLGSDLMLKRLTSHIERGVLESLGLNTKKKSSSKKNDSASEVKVKSSDKKKEMKLDKKNKKNKKRKKLMVKRKVNGSNTLLVTPSLV